MSFSEWNAGRATTIRNTSIPARIIVAAKWIARTVTRDAPSADQSISGPGQLLSHLEGEIAVRRVGVDRQHVPVHVIRACPTRLQRYRNLVAAHPCLAGVDPLS